jgi:D-tyrosyl-tRNA(Tyr) deacylase
MRLVLQRVAHARVSVTDHTIGEIGRGVLAFVGISHDDTRADADYLIEKLLWLRIFPDDAGKMNRNLQDVNGALLIVSQFTLYADCRKGRRPSFDRAAAPEQARPLYEYFVEAARRGGVPVQTGEFQAIMEVHLVNEGPVTILIDSADRRK